MLLTKLSVQNFGQFRDKHVFDLTTRDSAGNTKPLILFGGKNGAGKTTLFEAFRLCLYGSNLPEFRIRRLDYQDYIRSKIHRSSKLVLQPVTASIVLEFEYARLGKIERYTIERRWHRLEHGVEEEFHVSLEGKELEETEASQWQDFIKDLIPIGVSKLFFFDGEQIQALAEERTDEIRLRDSFYSLLGLDLVDRLQSDLKIRLTKNAKESDAEFGRELEALEKEQRKLEEEKEKIIQDNGHLKNILDTKKNNITKLEDKLAREGGSFAKRRDQLIREKSQLESSIEQIYLDIAQLCEGLLPFAVVPDYCRSLKERLIAEDAHHAQLVAQTEVEKSLRFVKWKTVASVRRMEINKNINRKLVKDISKIIEVARAKYQPTRAKKNTQIIHHLSSFEKGKILSWIDMVLEEVPKEIRHMSRRLEKLTTDLQKIGDLLNKAPADDVIGPLVKELNILNQEAGKIETSIKHNVEKIKQIDYKLVHVNVGIRELIKDKKRFEKMNRGIALVHRAELALQEYEERLKKEKLSQLADSLVECLNELMHKEIFLKVDIDPETFFVTLYDSENNAIPKDQLSAGEKQMYAIAILWALARTSGRPLPFIVDTPLGRLDSGHRLNLVQNFFPVASHQVIIFSTDTEVDEKYFEELQDDIAKSYKLEYDKNDGRTKVESGYFWKVKERENEVAMSK